LGVFNGETASMVINNSVGYQNSSEYGLFRFRQTGFQCSFKTDYKKEYAGGLIRQLLLLA
jgi:hypothetical protein